MTDQPSEWRVCLNRWTQFASSWSIPADHVHRTACDICASDCRYDYFRHDDGRLECPECYAKHGGRLRMIPHCKLSLPEGKAETPEVRKWLDECERILNAAGAGQGDGGAAVSDDTYEQLRKLLPIVRRIAVRHGSMSSLWEEICDAEVILGDALGSPAMSACELVESFQRTIDREVQP